MKSPLSIVLAMFHALQKTGFIDGLLAGIFGLLAMSFLRGSVGSPLIPESFSEALFLLVPGEVESVAVGTLGAYAKYLAFAGTTLFTLILFGLLGVLISKLVTSSSSGPRWLLAGLTSSWLFTLIVSIPSILGLLGFRRLPMPAGLAATLLIVPSLVFALAFLSFSRPRAQAMPVSLPVVEGRFSPERRNAMRRGLVAAGGLILFFLSLERLQLPSAQTDGSTEDERSRLNPKNLADLPEIFRNPRLEQFLDGEVTTNAKFYRVSKNIIDPTVDVRAWKLTVDGLVTKPLSLAYEELTRLPKVSEFATLECISNEVGGDLISNAYWTGVKLKDILAMAEPLSDAKYLVFHCADGYTDSITVSKAIEDGTVLAYLMNGVRLPHEHGAPLRAVIPGIFGMKNAKWITRIELVRDEYRGYWQKRGWSNTAEYHTMSQIDRTDAEGGSTILLAGIAFSGDRGISKVEFSVDDGRSWKEAVLKPALGDFTWRFWAVNWTPENKGRYKLMVRATDQKGRVQSGEVLDTFPNGASGYHTVWINV